MEPFRRSNRTRFFLSQTTAFRVAGWMLAVLSSLLAQQPASAFLATPLAYRSSCPSTALGLRRRNGSDNDNNNNSFDSGDTQLLQERLYDMRLGMLETELQRPPNPDLSPLDFVQTLIKALYNNEDPLPESGFRLLFRASTTAWRNQMRAAVGAPRSANEETVASALGGAMGRPHNQFGILVGEEDPEFNISFPTDPLDYADGTCWVECRLREKGTGKLLVIIGWQLQERPSDGAWLVDTIDWQDFRDDYRPGVGRQEWMRICD